jgi:hypothetical protein
MASSSALTYCFHCEFYQPDPRKCVGGGKPLSAHRAVAKVDDLLLATFAGDADDAERALAIPVVKRRAAQPLVSFGRFCACRKLLFALFMFCFSRTHVVLSFLCAVALSFIATARRCCNVFL